MKNHSLQVANQGADSPDVTLASSTIQAPKLTPKMHRARLYMLLSDIQGFSGNDILCYFRLSSGRNYFSEIERELNICLECLDEKNPGGIGCFFRYRFTSRDDVMKVINLVSRYAQVNQHMGLSDADIAEILSLYPDYPNAA